MDWNRFVKIATSLVFTFTTPAFADQYLDTAQELVKCAAVSTHASEVAEEAGESETAKTMEGTASGGLIAAQQSLENGGYREDYIDAVLPEWFDSHMQSFALRNQDAGYFQKAMMDCVPVINGPQKVLVNQWRETAGKAQ